MDLSCWSLAFNGAEPILAGTLDRFGSEFEECGFRRSAFRPCYGLAEATLLVSAADAAGPYIIEADARSLELNRVEPPTSPATTRRLVSSGPPASGQAVAIVNPETLERCEPNQVGEIWFSGPSVSDGYWKRPDETRERLMASLPGDMNTYLRTGDLGFVDEHGLFVTGRLKELIIVFNHSTWVRRLFENTESCDSLDQASPLPHAQPFYSTAFRVACPIIVKALRAAVILDKIKGRECDGNVIG